MTEEFIQSFLDFMQDGGHIETEDLLYLFYEQQAAELELPTDYFIQEFVL